jgi:hypothetical protein
LVSRWSILFSCAILSSEKLGPHRRAHPPPRSHRNGTAWTTVANPDVGSEALNSVATSPGAAIVWAVGASRASGSFNPLVLRNG